MSTPKELGNEAFKQKDYPKAIQFYTEAVELNPQDHTVYGNRAMAYANSNNFDKSLEDAEMCIKIKPDWGKGYHRKGAALHGKGELDAAVEVYQQGMKVDPANNAMKNGFDQLLKDKAAAEAGPGFAGTIPGGPGDMFGP